MPRNPYFGYHLLALAAVLIWGPTFASSKVLLQNGLTPADIMLYRFVLAYIAMWFVCERKLWANSLRDELVLMLAGLSGGTIYFLSENTALLYTQTTNVGIIIATIPLITALLSRVFIKNTRLSRQFMIGTVISLAGVVLLEMNGNTTLNISPLGDALALLAAIAWAMYNILIYYLYRSYSTTFITRKVFFYGLVTLLPVWLAEGGDHGFAALGRPVVFGNLLFLGLVASFVGYMMWNTAVHRIGSLKASNYIYLSPLITFATSYIFLDDEIITLGAAAGALAILAGVYIAERNRNSKAG